MRKVNTVEEVIKHSEILSKWNGIKGARIYKENGREIRIATSNSAIKNGKTNRVLTTPTIKQLYQYHNNRFNDLLEKGFSLKYRHFYIDFFGDVYEEEYYINVYNPKTDKTTLYDFNAMLEEDYKETDESVIKPVRELFKLVMIDKEIYNYSSKDLKDVI